MATPTIRATGSTTPANTPGESKQAYIVGETITFDDPANGGASTHLWQLIDKPPEQSSALVGPTTATPTLVIDAGVEGGTFRIRYTADGTEVGELLFAVQTTSVDVLNQRVPGYLEQDDARAAATEATWNAASNTQGWFPALYALLKAIIAAFAGTFRKTVSGEVNALTLKATPVAADVILIEDSASTFSKKKVTLSTLPGVTNVIHSSTVLGADATTMSVTGLDGDAHGLYELECQLLLLGGAGNIQLEPNGSPGTRSEVNNGGTPTDHTDWRLTTFTGVTAPYHYHFTMKFYAARTLNGQTRSPSYWFTGTRSGEGGTPFTNIMHGAGYVLAPSNIASLDFVASLANGILAGSQVTVRILST